MPIQEFPQPTDQLHFKARLDFSNTLSGTPRSGFVQHVVPRSQGGTTEWDNVVLPDKAINNQRCNQSFREAGLVLKIKPLRPRPQTVEHQIVRRPKIPTEWTFFLHRGNQRYRKKADQQRSAF